MATQPYDLLVIGSGAAGLTLALKTLEAKPDARVAVLAKNALTEGSTMYAQGGIAAVLDATDSTEAHVADTLDAGAGLCNAEVVRMVVGQARPGIQWLIGRGVAFDREGGDYHLTREGGHSHRRVIHAADATGRAVQTTLVERIQESRATILDYHIAVDLIRERLGGGRRGRCVGAYALNRKTGRVDLLPARVVALASGGASRVYLYSTNPDGSTGDGIAMGWRAGCRVANMEFSQFHPTCLYHHQAKSFLISEAVRGEGGRLLRPDGTRFMDEYDRRGELAPRDIVARAIDNEMKTSGDDCVFLDITHEPADFVRGRFPNIYQTCMEFGLDMTKEWLPVVPAAHYLCGGVAVNADAETDLPGLYTIGEAAFTGLHGANRLASNSLLEAAVYAGRAYKHSTAALKTLHCGRYELPEWDASTATNSDEMVVVYQNWDEIRRFMWNYVGIVRSDKRMERAMRRIKLIQDEIDEYYWNFIVTSDLIELRNIATVAELIVTCAQMRKESRGLHYNIDYADRDDINWKRDTFIKKQF